MTICLIKSIINVAFTEVKTNLVMIQMPWYLILWDVGYKCDERLQRDKLIIPKILTLLIWFVLLPATGRGSLGIPPPPSPPPFPTSLFKPLVIPPEQSRIMSSSFPTSRQWRVGDVTMKSVSLKLLVDCSSGSSAFRYGRLKSSIPTILRKSRGLWTV